MDRTEFDKFADEYRSLHQKNIAASGEAPEYFAEYKVKDLKRLVDRDGSVAQSVRILDFGTGVGTSVPFFCKHFPSADLTCVDVSLRSLEIGTVRFGNCATFIAFDGSRLPFSDSTFDYAFAACVFHHIPPGEHRQLFAEMRRVLRPGGQVMIYEHNPLNPFTVRAVQTCPFDANAILIRARDLRAALAGAGFRHPYIKYRVFFPAALRRLRGLEDRFAWLPIGAQYFVSGRS